MEKRDLNISFQKAGNGKNVRLIVPIPWLRELGITEEEKQVELIFDKENNQLILKKKGSLSRVGVEKSSITLRNSKLNKLFKVVEFFYSIR